MAPWQSRLIPADTHTHELPSRLRAVSFPREPEGRRLVFGIAHRPADGGWPCCVRDQWRSRARRLRTWRRCARLARRRRLRQYVAIAALPGVKAESLAAHRSLRLRPYGPADAGRCESNGNRRADLPVASPCQRTAGSSFFRSRARVAPTAGLSGSSARSTDGAGRVDLPSDRHFLSEHFHDDSNVRVRRSDSRYGQFASGGGRGCWRGFRRLPLWCLT